MSTHCCELCSSPETEAPLLAARFEGRELHFCPKCMPTLIHGLGRGELRQVLRRKAPLQD
jgi:Zn-finger nucleic acid-binding protein